MNNIPLVEIQRLCALPDAHQRKLEIAQCYRDRLGWAVHPLRGPQDGDEKGRGKMPLFKGWRNHTRDQATHELLAKHFGNGYDHNLGVVIRHPHVCIDLDSKADNGQSVRTWLEQHPELANIPRERTAGGAHLHVLCTQLPNITKNGKPHGHALVSKLNDKVTAELYFDGLNIVVSPSIHPSGATYTWEVVDEIPVIGWAQLKEWFGFRLPDEEEADSTEPRKARKSRAADDWLTSYDGDLRTLDLSKLFQSVNRLGDVISADKGTTAVECPWRNEHSDANEPWKHNDSSTIICAASARNRFPGFCCAHAHCVERGLKETLEWYEKQTPGIVDQHCARQWTYHKGQNSEDGRPRIVLPGEERPESEFATEVGSILAPKNDWFLKLDEVVVVRQRTFSERIKHLSFCRMEAADARTAIETHIETGVLRGSKPDKKHFVSKSMDLTMAKTLLSSGQFKKQLPEVVRILDVPIPIPFQGGIVLPRMGYDERFQSYCDPNAPAIVKMTLDEAKRWLSEVHRGFCWRCRQDLVHALARLITPFTRGLMGWDARFPLWFFKANRPRAGKDYLAGITLLVYEGFACEDAPLSPKDGEETRKRITSALVAGRRMMHFANCQGYLASQELEQAITSHVWGDRMLGGNTEVKLPNELEFSISANLSLSYREDLEPRMRRIELSYPQEDANSRTFPKPFLHDFVLQNRSSILSAIKALVDNWVAQGRPPGPTPFMSFRKWGEVVGGIMMAAGLGDPCLPHEHEAEVGGDQLTRAMKALFAVCYESKPETWLKKPEIYEIIQQNQADSDPLSYFGDIGSETDRSGKTKLGKHLVEFVGRELGQIKLERQDAGRGSRTDRASFRFVKIDKPGKDEGDEIAASVFPELNLASPYPSSGDLGDLGDLHNPAGIKTNINIKGEEKKERTEDSIYTQQGAAGLQSLQGLHPAGEAPTVLTHLDDLQIVASTIRQMGGPVALDIETYPPKDALNPYKGEIRLLTLAAGEQRPWILDLKAIGYDLGPLKPVLEASEIVGHNLKFDALWLRVKCGVSLPKLFCTMTASRLLTAGSDEKNDLGECLRRYLQIDLPKDQARSDWGQIQLSPQQLRYAADDVVHLPKLKTALLAEIEQQGLTRTLTLELELLPVVVEMEARGIAVDHDKLAAIRDQANLNCEASKTTIQDLVGDQSFNPNSPAQLQGLFEARGISLPDTSADTLAACEDPLAAHIRDYRRYTKLAEQAQTLLEAIGEDGRIHASFNPMGTRTGRFSSSAPNLQNISRESLRACFIASPGNKCIVADYSQIELRAAAVIATEEQMLKAFAEGKDLHSRTAGLILGKPEADVSKEDRKLAKAVNFGLLYGQSAQGLVRYAKATYGLDLTTVEAEQFRARFFNAYRGLQRWHAEARTNANVATEVRTISGRRRLLPTDPKRWWDRFSGLVNTVVQGSCADGLKQAMVELSRRLPAGAGIVSTVHDELIVETPESLAEETKRLVEECMVQAMRELFPEVPIEVEIRICSNWGEK